MKINTEVVQLLNARQDDLNVEVGLFKNLRNLVKVAGEEIPSLTSTISQFESRLRNRLSVLDGSDEELIEKLTGAVQTTGYKMKVYLTMDANSATLKRVGASEDDLKGIDKVKDMLQKELFTTYNISLKDFANTDVEVSAITKEIGNA